MDINGRNEYRKITVEGGGDGGSGGGEGEGQEQTGEVEGKGLRWEDEWNWMWEREVEGMHGYVPVSLAADSRYIILGWPPALSLQYTLHKATADGHNKIHHDQPLHIHMCVLGIF